MNSILKAGLFGLALTATTMAGAENLGRLFFTPEQRAQLEHGDKQDRDTPANVHSLTVNGIVQKHGGERTIWINGVPQIAGKNDERTVESMPVTVQGQAQPIKIKAGQKVLATPSVHGQ